MGGDGAMIGAICDKVEGGGTKKRADGEGNSAVCRGEVMGEAIGMLWGL